MSGRWRHLSDATRGHFNPSLFLEAEDFGSRNRPVDAHLAGLTSGASGLDEREDGSSVGLTTDAEHAAAARAGGGIARSTGVLSDADAGIHVARSGRVAGSTGVRSDAALCIGLLVPGNAGQTRAASVTVRRVAEVAGAHASTVLAGLQRVAHRTQPAVRSAVVRVRTRVCGATITGRVETGRTV